MKQPYTFERRPVACKENMVTGEHYRFTVLTNRMLRLEYSESGQFVDAATQSVLNRDFPKAEFQVIEGENTLEIITEYFHLRYDRQAFSPSGLEIQMYKIPYLKKLSTWYYGDDSFLKNGNLKGTTSTLDNTVGNTYYVTTDTESLGIPDKPVELCDGILSKNGVSLIDDSKSLVFGEDDWVYPADKNHIDLYFFAYGRDYLGCLKDYFYLTGNTPLLPRYVLGNWWSRYYNYTQEEYMELMNRFRDEKIPIAVSVFDMGWHLLDVGEKYGKGWTGYTWNRKLFPNPKEMMEQLHARGKHISLNVHPADGVRPYEAMYPEMAKALGMNPKEELPIPFDMTDREFTDAYFKYLHHPHEDAGVDFWWIDWQQGGNSKMEGYDPLWMLNHFHYLDNRRKGNRPLTFSRYAGIGSHRYPIGFSGSTFITWESLDYQPWFTATASNVGYGWWSHDIGGHRNGCRDDELTTRWVQFGAFSPVMRLHSSDEVFTGKEPWKFGTDYCNAMKKFLRLRHSLIPYIYTMNERFYRLGEPLVQPMYYQSPDTEDAYSVPNQYYFGTELIAAPITKKSNPETKTGSVEVWLPEGNWWDIFTGIRYTGGRKIVMHRSIDSIPVLAKAGAVIPMESEETLSDYTENPQKMDLLLFPGEDACFTLYEDDGVSMDYTKGKCAWTDYEWNWSEKIFRIHACRGETNLVPVTRSYVLKIYGIRPEDVEGLSVNGRRVIARVKQEAFYTEVFIDDVGYCDKLELLLKEDTMIQANDITGNAYTAINRAQIPFSMKERLYKLIRKYPERKDVISSIYALHLPKMFLEVIMELLLAEM